MRYRIGPPLIKSPSSGRFAVWISRAGTSWPRGLYGLSVRSWLLDRHSDIGTGFALAGQVDGLIRKVQDPRDQSDAAPAFASAITSLREPSAPYHLALGLLAYAEYLARQGDTDGAVAAVEEARGIAERLRCQPPLDRPADLMPAQSRLQP